MFPSGRGHAELSPGGRGAAWLASLFGARGLEMRMGFEASSTIAMLGLVAAGLGVMVYPEGIARLRPVGVAVRPIQDCPVTVQTDLVWKLRGVSPAGANFLAVCGVPAGRITLR